MPDNDLQNTGQRNPLDANRIPSLDDQATRVQAPAGSPTGSSSPQATGAQPPLQATQVQARPVSTEQAAGTPGAAGVTGALPVDRKARRSAEEHANLAQAASGKQPKKSHRGIKIAAALIVLALIGAYAGGVVYFTNYFYPKTEVAGIDVSLVDAETATERLRGKTDAYTLTVSGGDFTWTFTPDAATPVYDAETAVTSVLHRNNAMLWPVHLYERMTGQTVLPETQELTVETPEGDIDRSLLSSDFNQQAFCDNIGAAVDAYNANRSGVFDKTTAWDETTASFSADKVLANRKLNRDYIVNLALQALSNLESEVTFDPASDEALQPLAGDITVEQIQTACTTANEMLATNVTFKLGDSVAGTLDAATLSQWLSFDETLSPVLDDNAVTTWARQLASNMNTVGTTRTYTRPDGKQITVGGGTFGWTVDEDALVQSVRDAVTNKQTGDIQVPTSTEGDTYAGPGQRDWGAWLEADLTEQMARYYDANGNLLWESHIITGLPNGERDTPTGVFKVNGKARNITLVSRNIDPETGEPEYESPVDYWIAFKGSSYGFHDASWQSAASFENPNAYKSVGSHGCINTPHDKVEQLYNMISVGTCVIVHK